MSKTAVRKTWIISDVEGDNRKRINWPYEHRDWSTPEEVRIIEHFCPYDGVIVLTITCDDEGTCDREFIGQISDGILENVYFHKVNTQSVCDVCYDYDYSYVAYGDKQVISTVYGEQHEEGKE